MNSKVLVRSIQAATFGFAAFLWVDIPQNHELAIRYIAGAFNISVLAEVHLVLYAILKTLQQSNQIQRETRADAGIR